MLILLFLSLILDRLLVRASGRRWMRGWVVNWTDWRRGDGDGLHGSRVRNQLRLTRVEVGGCDEVGNIQKAAQDYLFAQRVEEWCFCLFTPVPHLAFIAPCSDPIDVSISISIWINDHSNLVKKGLPRLVFNNRNVDISFHEIPLPHVEWRAQFRTQFIIPSVLMWM